MSTRENDFLNYYIRQNQVKLQLAQNMQRGRHSVFIGRRQDMVLPSIFFFQINECLVHFFLLFKFNTADLQLYKSNLSIYMQEEI
jgi:hypothetical protein